MAERPDLAIYQASDRDERGARAGQLPACPRRTVTETALRHQARLLVEQVLKIVLRRLLRQTKVKSDGRRSKELGRAVETSNEYRPSTSKDEDVKVSPQIVKRYYHVMSSQPAGSSRRPLQTQQTAVGGTSALKQEPQAHHRLVFRDGESARTAATYALRKAAKTSLRRYSVAGNVKALMCAVEWGGCDDDVQIIAEPPSKSVTSPIYQDVKILLKSSADPCDDREPGQSPREDVPVEYPLTALSIPSKRQPRPQAGGVDQLLNSSYTYARRAEIKRALPKFLVSSSRDAMMTMFNAIRAAMAEEEIENPDYANILVTLMDRSRDEKDFPQQAKTSKQKEMTPLSPAPQSSLQSKAEQKPLEARPTDSSGKQVPSKPIATPRDRLNARQQNFGTLGTYSLRKATRSCLRHMLQKGSSYNALLMMACNVRHGQTDEEFWEEALDVDLDETTRKEVISDLADFSRQVRAGTTQRIYATDAGQAFVNIVEEESLESETGDFEKLTHRDAFGSRCLDEDTDKYRSGVHPQSNTNYTYGIHQSLRRLLPKFTGRRPYAALMHYANNMITDVHEEMIRNGQLVPMINFADAIRPELRQAREKVTRGEERYSEAMPSDGDRRSVATQTSKVVIKTKNETMFDDAYSWIAQETSNKYDTNREKQKYQPTNQSDSDMLFRSVEEKDRLEEELSPSAVQRDDILKTVEELPDEGAEEDPWLSVEEQDDADTTKRSVRFADGINPGEAGTDDEEHTTTFFQKLGYYERVGSGELLHKKPKKPKQKVQSTDEADIPQATLEPEEDDEQRHGEPSQEKAAEHPQLEEPQPTAEEGAKPAPLCNCL
ncbi:uncharacterized protein LOC110977028 isoform X2 [Acanthaster planci]|nr:uncharacterized protein LOC110977028 isoform X2 [Acanthaster planci]